MRKCRLADVQLASQERRRCIFINSINLSARSYLILRGIFPLLMPHRCSHKWCFHPFWITPVWHYGSNIRLEGLGMNFSHSAWWDYIRLPAPAPSFPLIIKSLYFLYLIHVWFFILFAEWHSGNCRRNNPLWTETGSADVMPSVLVS